MSENHSNERIIKICPNTKKNYEDLERLTVTLTPVENHPLTLVVNTLKEAK